MINVDIGAAWRRTLAGAAATALVGAGMFALAGPAAAVGNTLRVDLGGVDTPGCGTTVKYCASIQYAIDQSESGDTIEVNPGIYTGALNIDHALTLKGTPPSDNQPDSGSIIDGTESQQTGSRYGLVWIGPKADAESGTGDVSISGFTIRNAEQMPGNGEGGEDGPPISVVLSDRGGADDTITLDDNTIIGKSGVPRTAGGIGIVSVNHPASTVVTGNDISGVFQGVYFEASGPNDVEDNVIHNLTELDYSDGTTFGGQGVSLNSDAGAAMTDQVVFGNTFRNYAGLGISLGAGYASAGCSETPCAGDLEVKATQNTFQLDGTGPDVRTGAAFRLRAVSDSTLDLTTGGNVGQVTAPTQTILQDVAEGSTLNVIASGAPNAITPDPATTLDVDVPSSITSVEDPTDFAATTTVPEDGVSTTHARYDIAITGASGISAEQIKLQYLVSNPNVQNRTAGKQVVIVPEGTYENVPLTGTTADGGTITGYFGPPSGFPLPADSTNVTNFRISVPSASAPGGALTVKTSLVDVAQGPGFPAVNTQATDSDTLTVVANSKPTAADVATTTPVNVAKDVVLTSSDADDDAITLALGSQPSHGTAALQADGKTVRYTPAANYTGADSFTYTADDGKAGTSTGTVSITVTKVAARLGTITVSPTAPTSADNPKVTVPVTAAGGSVEGGTVALRYGTTTSGSAKVAGGKAVVTLPRRVPGSYVYAVTFNGTATAAATGTTYLRVNVAKVTTTITRITTSPNPITTATAKPQILVTVSAPNATVSGVTVTIATTSGVVQGTAKVGSNGVATVIVPKLPKGPHNWKATFAGSTTASAVTKNFSFTSK